MRPPPKHPNPPLGPLIVCVVLFALALAVGIDYLIGRLS